VENEIDVLPDVVESAVVGVPHPDFGECVVALAVPKQGAELSEKSVLAPLGDKLAKYKIPKRVIFLDELPRNAMGKVQKALLRETYKGLFAEGTN
jgi:malonyl-CoA/methylmalonyl-CoA synthetase